MTARRIGDVEPCPFPVDREAVAAVVRRRKMTAHIMKSGGGNLAAQAVRVATNASRAAAARAADPFERARNWLGAHGWTVIALAVFEDGRTGYACGSLRFADKAAVLAFARRRGWRDRSPGGGAR